MRIDGRHVVVTGASRGIGEAIAREFAQRGARLTLVARSTGPLAQLAVATGGRPLAADLAEPDQVEGLIERAEGVQGRVDILVNNAGIEVTKPLVSMTAQEVERIHAVNLIAPIQLTRQVLPGMIERRSGHVVNVSSMASAGGFPGLTTYAATKAGLSHFTRVLRQDLKTTPIKVTAVEVGPIPTDMLSRVDEYPPAQRSFDRLRRLQLMPNTPTGRVAVRIAQAVENEKRSVWLPTRAAVFPFLAGLPQRIVEPLLRGIDP